MQIRTSFTLLAILFGHLTLAADQVQVVTFATDDCQTDPVVRNTYPLFRGSSGCVNTPNRVECHVGNRGADVWMVHSCMIELASRSDCHGSSAGFVPENRCTTMTDAAIASFWYSCN
ncbi:hypothetical protein B0T16DRAFT_450347 [Cercophora newfieldiana]|uniref:Secreted protein n=1 Tax=Cercophora newfieldiana TaxID=92897 RepID=A0AA39XVA3_9PEZI|nr:hypothetical protein B0T16DRAFT_450347 [Cercophora newfieldiana]